MEYFRKVSDDAQKQKKRILERGGDKEGGQRTGGDVRSEVWG